MKLYQVEVTYSAYVYAESEFDAEDFADEITDNTCQRIIHASVVREGTNPLGWHPNTCVYHAGNKDLYLKQVLATSNPLQQ